MAITEETLHEGDLESGIPIRHSISDKPRTSHQTEKVESESVIGPIEENDATIAETLSRTRSWKDPGPPPDGGMKAWIQVLMGHLIIFNTWGYINSFGVFQTYYVSALNSAPSDIAWVGSVQIFLLFFVGTFSGRMTDAGYFRPSVGVGCLLQLIGVFMTSLSTKYWQLFLAQGVCTGLGNGLVFCPAIAVVSTYFSKKKAVAIGLAACGTATGGVVFPVIAQQLLPKIGFGWTVRIMGFIMLATMSIVMAFARTRLPPRKTGPLVEWSAFKELPYALYAASITLLFWGLYFAFFYIGTYAVDILGTNEKTSISLLLVLNGSGVPGRLIPNILSDRYFGPLNTMIPFAAISAALLYIWIGIGNVGGMYAFAVIYGSFASGLLSLFPAVLASLTPDLSKTGVRMGMVFTCLSFANLTGPPIGGALIQLHGGSYLSGQVFAGTTVAGGLALLTVVRFLRTGPVFIVKI
ncbi:MAG: hypothetical protein M1827_005206 [Pycnora praestabilis]|nr:MAG: hypothetical protein M1827_005206 [Pycnora praestabilis]